jgi:hypothetical protein
MTLDSSIVNVPELFSVTASPSPSRDVTVDVKVESLVRVSDPEVTAAETLGAR